MFRRSFYYLALGAWIVVIFWFSSQPDLSSGLETWKDLVLRKAAHLAEYFVLAFLWIRSRAPARSSAVSALVFAGAVAAADEWYQTTVRGRSGRIADVGVDVAGAALLLLLRRFLKVQKKV
ncbi:MAG: VanZ family protein [bacterium]|nr:VanZ family protein [bacterium]